MKILCIWTETFLQMPVFLFINSREIVVFEHEPAIAVIMQQIFEFLLLEILAEARLVQCVKESVQVGQLPLSPAHRGRAAPQTMDIRASGF
jgi:hypothetical protein